MINARGAGGPASVTSGGLCLEPMEQRQQERSGFARARLRLARDVLAVEGQRQSLALNRRALNETGFGDSLAVILPTRAGRRSVDR